MSLLKLFIPHFQCLNYQVDIYQYPTKINPIISGDQHITIGDMHANTMKFFFMLVTHGFASMSADDYAALVRIYKIKQHTNDDLLEYEKLLNRITFRNLGRIRLIGDELADRGTNDYLTLKLYEVLRRNHIKIETLLSNHSAQFILEYEQGAKNNPFAADIAVRLSEQYASLRRYQELKKQVYGVDEEMSISIEEGYLPTLKLLSYSLVAYNAITIYSHAPIDLSVIQSLANKLGVGYDAEVFNVGAQAVDSRRLAAIIDAINCKFQIDYVRTNKIHELTLSQDLKRFNPDWAYKIDYKKYPIFYLIWNRNHSTLYRNQANIKWVHGHDPERVVLQNVFNLDNSLGKYEDKNIGTYSAILSNEVQRDLSFDPLDYFIRRQISRADMINKQAKMVQTTLVPIERAILAIKKQTQLLNKTDNATVSASILTQEIEHYLQEYKALRLTKQAFTSNCNRSIDKARFSLYTHTTLKQLFLNLVLAIALCGVFYVVASCMNKSQNGRFLFFSATPAASKIPIRPLEVELKKLNTL